MKLFLLKLVALIIAISSSHLNVSSRIDFNFMVDDALASQPLLDVEPIHNPASKSAEVLTISIPTELAPETLFISTQRENLPFLYYLPIYSLTRPKDFFLLI